jgi:hypothetical protein
MRKFLIIFILLPLKILAQTFETQMGKVINASEFRDMFEVTPSLIRLGPGSTFGKLSFFDTKSQTGYQGFNFGGKKEFQVGTFENYNEFTGTKVLRSEMQISEDQSVFIHGFLSISDKFFILYSVNDKKANEERIYVNQLSKDMLVMGSPLPLITFDEKKSQKSPIYFSQSPDKKTFVIAREYVHNGVTESITIKTFDQNFKEVYRTDIEVSGMQDLFVLNDVAITKNTNLFLFGTIDPRADNLVVFAASKNKAIPTVIAYEAKSGANHQIAVAEPGVREYYDYRFFLDEHNEPVVISAYNAPGNAIGYSFAHISCSKLEVDWNTRGIISADADKIFRKYKSRREFVQVKDFTKLGTGEFVFTMENNYITSNNSGSFSNSGAILVSCIAPGGEKSWEKLVYKHQKFPGTRLHSSHHLLSTGEGMVLIYNDHQQNLQIAAGNPKFKRLKNFSKSIPVAVEIDSQGNLKKSALINGPDWGGYLLDIPNVLEIDPRLFQCKISKYGFFKYDTAYGRIELKP